MDILFEQHYEWILKGHIVRMANIDEANKDIKEFRKRNPNIIMIEEGIKQHFMLKDKLEKFKSDMLFEQKRLEKELNGVLNAISQSNDILKKE